MYDVRVCTVCCADPTQTITMGIGMDGAIRADAIGREQNAGESPRFEGDFTTSARACARVRALVFLAGSHSNHIVSPRGRVGETCELFNALLKPRPARTRNSRGTVLFQLTRPPEHPTLRHETAKLCANFAYILFGSVKGSRPAPPTSVAGVRKDFGRARAPSS